MIHILNLQPRHKNSRSLSKLSLKIAGLIISIIFILLGFFIINIRIHKYSTDYMEVGTILNQIYEEIHQLNTLERQIIRSGEKPDQNKLNDIYLKQKQVLDHIHNLRDYSNEVMVNSLKEHRRIERIEQNLSFAGYGLITTIAFGLIILLNSHLHKIQGSLLKKNGEAFSVGVGSTSEDFADQRIFVNIIRYITERNKAEKLISDKKDFAENLIHNLTIPTFVLDSNHHVMIWNKACEELTGVKAEDVLGTKDHWKGFYKIQTPCLSDAVIEGSVENLPDQYKYWNRSSIIAEGLHAEAWFENLGGLRRFIIIEAAPIYDNNQNLVAVIETIQDLTDRKNAEEAVLKYHQKIQKELELASKIQTSLLPQKLPSIPNVKFTWRFEPSVYVAGDMFDIFQLDEGNIGFYILDVKGHGISAALNAVTLNHILSPLNYKNGYFDASDRSSVPLPSQVLKKLNDNFSEGVTNTFFTIVYGIININSLEMTYARAGHCPPIVVSGEGKTELLSAGGVAIGMLKDTTYDDSTVQLKVGDKVLLYTDGVMESDKISDKPFMVEDLVDLIGKNHSSTVTEIADLIVTEAKDRTQNLDTLDDITVVGFQIT